jgi:hypothetical protein
MLKLLALALLLIIVTLALWVLWGEALFARRWRQTPLDDRDLRLDDRDLTRR